MYLKKKIKSKLTILLTSLFSLTAYLWVQFFTCFSEHKINFFRVWIKEDKFISYFLIFFTPMYKHMRLRNIINEELYNFVDKIAIIECQPWNWNNKCKRWKQLLASTVFKIHREVAFLSKFYPNQHWHKLE